MIWPSVLEHIVFLIEGLRVLVSTQLHLLELLLLPSVHLERADEGDVDAHGAVLASALVA